jgi:hypothetical protein
MVFTFVHKSDFITAFVCVLEASEVDCPGSNHVAWGEKSSRWLLKAFILLRADNFQDTFFSPGRE